MNVACDAASAVYFAVLIVRYNSVMLWLLVSLCVSHCRIILF